MRHAFQLDICLQAVFWNFRVGFTSRKLDFDVKPTRKKLKKSCEARTFELVSRPNRNATARSAYMVVTWWLHGGLYGEVTLLGGIPK